LFGAELFCLLTAASIINMSIQVSSEWPNGQVCKLQVLVATRNSNNGDAEDRSHEDMVQSNDQSKWEPQDVE
jgi:hypothetical protein